MDFYLSIISIIFGILSVVFNHFNFKKIAAVFAVVSILWGGYLTCTISFPSSLLGGISVILGMATIKNY